MTRLLLIAGVLLAAAPAMACGERDWQCEMIDMSQHNREATDRLRQRQDENFWHSVENARSPQSDPDISAIRRDLDNISDFYNNRR